jgi:hypothetical protein
MDSVYNEGDERVPQIVALKSKKAKVHTALIQNAGLAVTEDILEASVKKELSPRRGGAQRLKTIPIVTEPQTGKRRVEDVLNSSQFASSIQSHQVSRDQQPPRLQTQGHKKRLPDLI